MLEHRKSSEEVMLLKVVTGSSKSLLARVARLKGRLSVLEGLQTRRTRVCGKKAFGKALSPQESVDRIVDDVRARGNAAVCEWTAKLDGVEVAPRGLRVSAKEIEAAGRECPRDLLRAMKRSIANVKRYQRHFAPQQKPTLAAGGRRLQQRVAPLARVGVYVPGGEAAYPSTVVMTALVAKVAGVREVALATPPGRDGTISPSVLAAAGLIGVDEVYRVGGAQAIAALAFGTKTIRPVDKIVGPGNIFVNLAKRKVFGVVDIDMFAGPSEVLILADSSAKPSYLAADLAAQAEHAPGVAVLVSTSRAVIAGVRKELARMLETLSRADAIGESLEEFTVAMLASSRDEMIEIANALAPEHLEIHMKDARVVSRAVRNAGAIFLGAGTPTALGDYIAGPSHTLPTGGTARFFSGLSAHDFVRRTSVTEYSERALREEGRATIDFAEAEGLTAHARSIEIRMDG